jgi:CDP-diacylglycerol--glycerol-3-phosphate 3-phosphatidyltransferase
MTISDESRTRVKGAFEPVALAMGRAGLTPDALTVIGFAITLVGGVLLSQQAWLLGGLVVFLGGVFDMFDGTLARATGRVSVLGAFMDSVFDRAGEAVVYVGLIAGLGASGWADAPIFAGAAMAGAFMVSYARAKAEGLGFSPGTGMAAVGVMPREVRLVILTMGLILGGLALAAGGPTVAPGGILGAGGAALPLGILIIDVALAIIAVGATITVIQRILHVRHQAQHAAAITPQTPTADGPGNSGEHT